MRSYFSYFFKESAQKEYAKSNLYYQFEQYTVFKDMHLIIFHIITDERLIESLPAEFLASSIELERSQNGHQEDELQESYRSKTNLNSYSLYLNGYQMIFASLSKTMLSPTF